MAPHGCERFEALCQALGLPEPEGRRQLASTPRSPRPHTLAPAGGVHKLRRGQWAPVLAEVACTKGTAGSASAATHAVLGVCTPPSKAPKLCRRHAEGQPAQQHSLQRTPSGRQRTHRRQQRQQQRLDASASLTSGGSVTSPHGGAAGCRAASLKPVAVPAAYPTSVLAALDACVFSAGMALILATMPPADVLQLVCARRFLAAFPSA